MGNKKRYYLENIGYTRFQDNMEDDKRNGEWAKQREKYGFDDRETWNLDSTMAELLYERLKMFDEVNIVDTGFHKVEFRGKEYTQQEAMDFLMLLLERRLTEDNLNIVSEAESKAWQLWSILIDEGIMWW